MHQLRLLNAFEVVRNGVTVELRDGAQRLVAFVGLRRRRSMLWRIQKAMPGLLDTNGGRLRLPPDVWVDLHDAEQLAQRPLTAGPSDERSDLRLLAADLLPDWYDELTRRVRVRGASRAVLVTVTLPGSTQPAKDLLAAFRAGVVQVNMTAPRTLPDGRLLAVMQALTRS